MKSRTTRIVILFILLLGIFYYLHSYDNTSINTIIIKQQLSKQGYADNNISRSIGKLVEKKGYETITQKEIGIQKTNDKTTKNVKPKIERLLKEQIKKNQKNLQKREVIVKAKDIDKLGIKGTRITKDLVSAKLTPDEIKRVANNSEVIKVYANRKYKALSYQTTPPIDTREFWKNNYTGKDVKVAILDTGINTQHPIFIGKKIVSKDFTGNDSEDHNGHGTHIAGVVSGKSDVEGYYGIAPDSDLINAKVLNDYGEGSTATIVAGINWATDPDNDSATEDGADVISISIGAPMNEQDELIDNAIDDAIRKGATVVVASGNCGRGCSGFRGVTIPGSYEKVITVGATDNNMSWADFSSGEDFGDYIKPDITAPGVKIKSAVIKGYAEKSGTSMATPFISGLAALLIERNRSLTHSKIKKILEDNSIDLGTKGKDIKYGSGFVNVSRLLKYITDNTDNNTNITTNLTVNITSNVTLNILNGTNTTQKTSNNTNITSRIVLGYKKINLTKILNPILNVGKARFIKLKNVSNGNGTAEIILIYSLNNHPLFVRVKTFSDEIETIKHFYETVPLLDKNKVTITDRSAEYGGRYYWYSNSRLYIAYADNNTPTRIDKDVENFISEYASKTKSEIGKNYDETIKHLRIVDKDIIKSISAAAIKKYDNKKNAGFNSEWGGDTPSNSDEINFGGDYSETFWTQRADNWYHTTTSRRGTLEFGVYDIDPGDDVDLYVYDYTAKNLLCSSTKSSSSSEHCIVQKDTDTEWGFYIKIVPYVITNSYTEANLYSSASCSEGWMDLYDCGSGNKRLREWKNRDCTTKMKVYESCDNQDHSGPWNGPYCDSSSGDIEKSRTNYDYSCDGRTKSCTSQTKTETSTSQSCSYGCDSSKDICYECTSDSQCSSSEKCSNNVCVAKGCSDFSNTYGSCSNEGEKTRSGDKIYECKDQIIFGQILCKEQISKLGADNFCAEAKATGKLCQKNEYDCDFDSECENGLQCKGPIGGTADGCCNSYEEWDSSTKSCYNSCSLESVEWNKVTAIEGDTATINVKGTSACVGKQVALEIYEDDCFEGAEYNNTNVTENHLKQNYSDQGLCDDYVTTLYTTLDSNGDSNKDWTTRYMSDILGDPEYTIIAKYDGKEKKSTKLLTIKQKCRDNDNDGYGDGTSGCSFSQIDCDDSKNYINPGMTEVCNFKDDNCNGQIDEGGACSCILSNAYWSKNEANKGEKVTLTVTGNSNCNGKDVHFKVYESDALSSDDLATQQPETTTFNNGKGESHWLVEWANDESGGPEYYFIADVSGDTKKSSLINVVNKRVCIDNDNDGYGTANQNKCSNTQTDCNDNNNQINPSSNEVCNNIDDNCDGNVDENFNLKTDINNCGSCGNACVSGEVCDKGQCVVKNSCGDGICQSYENKDSCSADCYSKFLIEDIKNIQPTTAVEGENIKFTATIKNIGTYSGTKFVEGGIVPEMWAGKFFPTAFSSQSINDNPYPMCPGNNNYESKVVSIAPGTTESVRLSVTAPTKDSINQCGDPISVWDVNGKFRLIVGTYDKVSGGDYDEFYSEPYSLSKKNEICEYPYGVTASCSCKDYGCPSGEICSLKVGSGTCIKQDVACDRLPDGSSENCECHSDIDCAKYDNNTRCLFSQGYNECVLKNVTDKCTKINSIRCANNDLYRCEQTGKIKDWILENMCTSGYVCDESQNKCINTENYELRIDNAPQGVRINKLKDDIVIVDVIIGKDVDNEYDVEYDSDSFDIIKGKSCIEHKFIEGDNICVFKVTGSDGLHTFKFGRYSQAIRIIDKARTGYITNSRQLERRYADSKGVKQIFSKIYEKAERNDGVIYDMYLESVYGTFTSKHPFDYPFRMYYENIMSPLMTNNTYVSGLGRFVNKKLKDANSIIIVGDDYIIPYNRETYLIRAGSLPYYIRGLYNTLREGYDFPKDNSVQSLLLKSVKKLLPNDIVVEHLYTDQDFVQRTTAYSYDNLDKLFRHDESSRGNEIEIIIPDNMDANLTQAIERLKQTLLDKKLVDKKDYFEEVKGSEITCNDFNRLGNGWLFSPLKVSIVIGTQKTNPALSCYPTYDETMHNVISIEPNVWNKGSAIVMNTNDSQVIDEFSKIIYRGTYKDLHGRSYIYFHDSITATMIIFSIGSFGTGSVLGAAGEGIFITSGAVITAADIADNCIIREYDDRYGLEYGIRCGTSAIPAVSYTGGRLFNRLKLASFLEYSKDNVRAATMRFTESAGGDIWNVLNKIPEKRMGRFKRMLARYINVRNGEAGSIFGKKLTRVMKDANIKPSIFEKDAEMIDILGKAVYKHKYESDKVLRAISDVFERNPEDSKHMLEIIGNTYESWNVGKIKKLGKLDSDIMRYTSIIVKGDKGLFGSYHTKTTTEVLILASDIEEGSELLKWGFPIIYPDRGRAEVLTTIGRDYRLFGSGDYVNKVMFVNEEYLRLNGITEVEGLYFMKYKNIVIRSQPHSDQVIKTIDHEFSHSRIQKILNKLFGKNEEGIVFGDLVTTKKVPKEDYYELAESFEEFINEIEAKRVLGNRYEMDYAEIYHVKIIEDSYAFAIFLKDEHTKKIDVAEILAETKIYDIKLYDKWIKTLHKKRPDIEEDVLKIADVYVKNSNILMLNKEEIIRRLNEVVETTAEFN